MATEDLTPWLNRVKAAGSRKQLFSTLDEFRKADWTDEQCAVVSKLYIRLLDRLEDDTAAEEVVASAEVKGEDGPVWYEKM
jgi:hypothetical protein